MQEVRWQSNDESVELRWTVGPFWQLAKEGSIEKLEDPHRPDQQLLQYLYGETATAFFGNYFSCPTNAAYTYIPACRHLLQLATRLTIISSQASVKCPTRLPISGG